jgi:hypothetical protein
MLQAQVLFCMCSLLHCLILFSSPRNWREHPPRL